MVGMSTRRLPWPFVQAPVPGRGISNKGDNLTAFNGSSTKPSSTFFSARFKIGAHEGFLQQIKENKT
jgi:hypothetical protein